MNPQIEERRAALQKLVRFFYDIQRLRIQAGGRIQRQAEGGESKLNEHDKALLEGRMKELEKFEKNILNDVKEQLARIPFFVQVLSDKTRYKGVGPTMAGVLLSELQIETHTTVSKLWAFAGLRPIPALRCPKCFVPLGTPAERGEEDHLQPHPKSKCIHSGKYLLEKECIVSGKAQKPVKGEKLTYNKWLRTKLVGVLGPILLKVNSPWRKFYDDYKHRKQSAGWGVSDGHRHNAAIRYMVKMLLQDIWREWRTFEGLPVRPPYMEEYLQREHTPDVARPKLKPQGSKEEVREQNQEAEIAAELALLG